MVGTAGRSVLFFGLCLCAVTMDVHRVTLCHAESAWSVGVRLCSYVLAQLLAPDEPNGLTSHLSMSRLTSLSTCSGLTPALFRRRGNVLMIPLDIAAASGSLGIRRLTCARSWSPRGGRDGGRGQVHVETKKMKKSKPPETFWWVHHCACSSPAPVGEGNFKNEKMCALLLVVETRPNMCTRDSARTRGVQGERTERILVFFPSVYSRMNRGGLNFMA